MQKNILIFISLLSLLSLSFALPPDFIFGTATAAYQIEGAYNEGGKGASIWDYFSNIKGIINNNDTGNIADDFYHRYEEDIQLMRKMGLKNLRISISWPRIFPEDNYDRPNDEGVRFYNNLIDKLIENGIEPWVTLFHWDLPQVYNDFSERGTWLNENIPHKFNLYADFCFKTFGDRVKNWLTMNEIQTFTWLGYGQGIHAPGRCSKEFNENCAKVGGGGNSSTEPYIAAHHALISHALAVKTYREKYQKKQNGKIGMTINSDFILPFNASDPLDIEAANIQMVFSYGWFADPIIFGDYPEEMKRLVSGSRLPTFNKTMKDLLRNSCDFLGLNYYTASYGKWTEEKGTTFSTDPQIIKTIYNASGHILGPQADSKWLIVYPEGLYGKLKWINSRYNKRKDSDNLEKKGRRVNYKEEGENPYSIIIFENGVSCPGESELPISDALNDTFRVDYVKSHLFQLNRALEEGVPVKGYFLWSFMDNFEWADGYNVRFGIVYVDYKNNISRTLKSSGLFYADLIRREEERKNGRAKDGFLRVEE